MNDNILVSSDSVWGRAYNTSLVYRVLLFITGHPEKGPDWIAEELQESYEHILRALTFLKTIHFAQVRYEASTQFWTVTKDGRDAVNDQVRYLNRLMGDKG